MINHIENESRRNFMKVLAGVGAGIAFSSTLGSFVSKAVAAPTVGSSIEAGIAYPLSTGLILQLLVGHLLLLQTCIF